MINTTKFCILTECHVGIFLVNHKRGVCAPEVKFKIYTGNFKAEELGFFDACEMNAE